METATLKNPLEDLDKSLKPIEKVMAVSYTHLDVYKRQK